MIVIAIDVSFAIIVIVDMIKIVIGIINVIVRKCVLRDWVMVGAVRNGCEVDRSIVRYQQCLCRGLSCSNSMGIGRVDGCC